jgi:hypothetical protein
MFSGSVKNNKAMIKYKRNTKTVSGRLHDELIMMDLDQGKYFSLNPVATRIWDLLAEPAAIEELCSVLTKEYDVSDEQCGIEVSEYLDQMIRLGLAERVNLQI